MISASVPQSRTWAPITHRSNSCARSRARVCGWKPLTNRMRGMFVGGSVQARNLCGVFEEVAEGRAPGSGRRRPRCLLARENLTLKHSSLYNDVMPTNQIKVRGTRLFRIHRVRL